MPTPLPVTYDADCEACETPHAILRGGMCRDCLRDAREDAAYEASHAVDGFRNVRR